ncbi:hypothetical protein ACIO8G_37075 [Streptomyces sp. NPDC087219]
MPVEDLLAALPATLASLLAAAEGGHAALGRGELTSSAVALPAERKG